MNSDKNLIYLVCNFVKNDSRVLKVAVSAQKSKLNVTIIGFQNKENKILTEKYLGTKLILFPQKYLLEISHAITWNKPLFQIIQKTNIWSYLKGKEIIYSHDIVGLIVIAYCQRILALENIYIPWIHDCHEYMYGSYLYFKKIGNKQRENYLKNCVEYEKKYINEPDELITVSSKCAEKIKNIYSLDRNFTIIFNCPSKTLIRNYKTIRGFLDLKRNEKIIVWSGSVNQSRGTHIIVESLKYLHNFHLVILSDQKNEYVDNLKKLAFQNNNSERLHFLKPVPYNCVTSFIRDCDYGVTALLKENENNIVALPNKFFEYLHAGIPIISSDVDAMEDFIKRFDVGYVFKNSDPQDFAHVVLNAERNSQVKKKNEKILNRFSWEYQEKKLNDLYKKIFSQSTLDKNKQKNLRIIHLPVNAGQQSYYLAKIGKKIFLKSDNVNFSHKFNFQSTINFTIDMRDPVLDQLYLLVKLSKMYDVFHYHSRPIFFKWQPDYSFNFFDLPFLKSQNKKIIFTLRGSETRLESKFMSQEFNFKIAKTNDLVRLKLFKYIRKYADHITALDPELCSYFGETKIIPRSIEKVITEQNIKNNKKITFLHCPSKPERKGTDVIVSAFNELRNEGYDFDFKNLLNLTHSELMSEIMKSDVLIDQLIIGWYGIVAVEAMSRGTPVISYIRKDFEDYVNNNNIPIINANPKNIKYVIKKILDESINLTEYKKKSLNFVKSFHLSKNVFEQYKKLYLLENKRVHISREDKLMIKKFFKKNLYTRKLRISYNLIYESKFKLKLFYIKIKNYFYSKKIIREIYKKTKFFYNKIK